MQTLTLNKPELSIRKGFGVLKVCGVGWLCLGLLIPSVSQSIKHINAHYSTLKLNTVSDSILSLYFDNSVTACRVLSDENTPFRIDIQLDTPTMQSIPVTLSKNHCDGFEMGLSSSLVIFKTPLKHLVIKTSGSKQDLSLQLFHSGETPEYTAPLNKTSDRCSKPGSISYRVWRQGLPDPKPGREATSVEHLVIHHSAGDNSDTNYINTVRNIYLLHTQGNGWDDIGYNFLIAPNGQLFIGRDPQGVTEDDNILGAHFCSKNQNTMGICLLGNFMTEKPDPRAIQTLNYLMAWKLNKDKLSAFGQSTHPKVGGSMLSTICGHREGCSTSCPGDSFYTHFKPLKVESKRIADSCKQVSSQFQTGKSKVKMLIPNPNVGVMHFMEGTSGRCMIHNSLGQTVFESEFMSGQTFQLFLREGIYFYTLIESNSTITKGKLIIKDNHGT